MNVENRFTWQIKDFEAEVGDTVKCWYQKYNDNQKFKDRSCYSVTFVVGDGVELDGLLFEEEINFQDIMIPRFKEIV
jgi:hypothetical protein